MTRKTPQALFLDRDGTLIEWVHYLSDPDQVRLCDGVAAALKRAKQAGCLLFMHTNQSGVGRGYFGLAEVESVNDRMFELLGVESSFFHGFCVATDHPFSAGEKSYRKPRPRYELEEIARHSLNPEQCYMIGDSRSDLDTGLAAGMRSVLIRSEQTTVDERSDGVEEYPSVASFVDSKF